MSPKPFYIVLLSAVLSVAATAVVLKPQGNNNAHESVFERVMRTRELRCGYYVYPPITYRDPNTKELSGLSVDMMNEIGKRAGIKIIWAEEYGWAGWTQSLTSNRFDVACTPNWPDIPTGGAVTFTDPMFYAGLYPVVRADDRRFVDGNLTQFNSPDITFAVVDGDAIASLVPASFPKAKMTSQPAGSDLTAFLQDVLTKKADALLWDQNAINQTNAKNKNVLRMIKNVPPVKLQSFVMATRRDELVLANWLDTAILDLQLDGTMDRLLKKWEAEPGKTFQRVALPIEK